MIVNDSNEEIKNIIDIVRKRKRRKHHELKYENEIEKFSYSKRKKQDNACPINISVEKEFQILSPYLARKFFPTNFFFTEYFTKTEYEMIDNILKTIPENTNGLKFFFNVNRYFYFESICSNDC